MVDIADLGMRFSNQGGDQHVRLLDQVAVGAARAEGATESLTAATVKAGQANEAYVTAANDVQRRVVALKSVYDPLAASMDRVNRELAEAQALYKQGALSADEYTRASTALQARLNGLNVAHAAAARGARLTAFESANLGRQFADVGVQLAAGTPVWMIAVQQGTQVADVFSTAAMRGGGLSGVLKSLAADALAFVKAWGPLALVVAAVGAALWAAFDAFTSINEVSSANAKIIDSNEEALDAYSKAAKAAERASGDLRRELELDTEAARQNAIRKREMAQANLEAAKAQLALMRGAPELIARNFGNDPESALTAGIATGLAEGRAKAQVEALTKAIREQDLALKQLDQDLTRGARSMLDSLRQQNTEFGKTRAEVILLNAAREAANLTARADVAVTKESRDALRGEAAQLLATARQAAANADAQDKAANATKRNRDALRDAEKAAREAARAYEELVRATERLTDRYATPVERETERIVEDMRDLRAAVTANLIPLQQYAELRERIYGASRDPATFVRSGSQIDFFKQVGPIDLPELSDKAIKDWLDPINDNIRLTNAAKDRMADDFGSAFADGVESAFDGSFGSFLKRTFRSIFHSALSGIGTSLGNMVLGSPAGGALGGAGNLIAGGLGLAGSISTGISVAGSGATTAMLAGSAGSVGGGAMAGIGAALASNPVGWAIAGAGLVAGVLGIFGGGGKKKKEAMEAEAARAQAELNGLTEAGTELHDQLAEAYERESDALRDTIDQFNDFADSLAEFRRSLDTGPLALLSPEAQYKADRALFTDTAAKARLGDPKALGDLQAVSEAYLEASQAYYASSGRYFADLADVKAAVEAAQGTAMRTAENAKTELDVLKQSVAGLIDINDSVISVREAIEAMNGGAAGGPNYAAYVTSNPDLKTEYLRSSAQFGSVAAYGQWHYETFGRNENRPLPGAPTGDPSLGFASTGSFRIGGVGARRFGPATVHGGEIVDIRRPYQPTSDNSSMERLLQSIEARLAAVQAELAAVKQQVAQHGEAVTVTDTRNTSRVITALMEAKTERLARGGSAA